MLASLNHPNICGIYGIEESDGIRFLILEHVEGETLADRLAAAQRLRSNGAGLSLTAALTIARQIAEGSRSPTNEGSSTAIWIPGSTRAGTVGRSADVRAVQEKLILVHA